MSTKCGGRSAFERSRACEECGFAADASGRGAAATGTTVGSRHECLSRGTEHVRRYRP